MVAAGCSKESSKDLYSDASSKLPSRDSYMSALAAVKDMCEPTGSPVAFNVPDGEGSLKFGSFDDLIRLTDDMQKHDSTVEGICRRIERTYLELEPSKGNDPMNEFKILSQTKTMNFNEYLRSWRWDDAKYPKMRGLQNNLTLLLSVANKLDEEARSKAGQYNELKSAQANMQKKASGSLLSRDLTDVLTPAVVKEGDFVQTAHLTTMICIIPQIGVEPFLQTYEKYAENVVPGSAKQFESVVEEDGTQVWRVVLFKANVEAFLKKARDERVATCRVFEYSEAAYEKVKAQRDELGKECAKQEKMMKGFCKASLSDVMIAWVHIKAMRVFVESTLRFGVPPTFAAFVIQPKDNMQAQVRKALSDILGKAAADGAGGATGGDDDEEYYPYVSLSFTPFTIQKGF
jgi:V-type H+-transporting ATPase subunit C